MFATQIALAENSSAISQRENHLNRKWNQNKFIDDYYNVIQPQIVDKYYNSYGWKINDYRQERDKKWIHSVINSQFINDRDRDVREEIHGIFRDAVEKISAKRKKSSYKEREQAMLLILYHFVRGEFLNEIKDSLLETTSDMFIRPKSELEMMLSLSLFIVSILELCNSDDLLPSDTVKKHCHRVVTRLFGHIQAEDNSMDDTSSSLEPALKGDLIIAYSFLNYLFLYWQEDDLSGNNEKVIDSLLLIAEKATPQESYYAMRGIGLIISAYQNPNDIIEETIMPRLVSLLNSGSAMVSSGAAMIIALCFQSYDYGDDTKPASEYNVRVEQIPTDFNELLNTLKTAESQLNRKGCHVDRGDRKLIFKDIKKTINAYSTSESRKKLTGSAIMLDHLKDTSMEGTDTWATVILMDNFKWLLGPGCQYYLSINKFMESMLYDSFYLLPEDYTQNPTIEMSDAHKFYENITAQREEFYDRWCRSVARSKKIKNERLNKHFS